MDEATVRIAQEMRIAGLTLRDIAEQLLGARTKESTVRYNLRKYYGDEIEEETSQSAKVLVFDIETAPCMSYHWRRWKENIGQAQSITESYMLTWAAKWLDDDAVISDTLVNYDNYERDKEDDSPIIKSLANMIEQADVVIAHNGKRFDLPVLRTRMLYHGMTPMNPPRLVDTLQVAKKEFKFPSNSLQSIAQYLGLGGKVDTGGFELWRACMEGDPDAWEHMLVYNEQDVVLLEAVYKALRPWDTRHPNVALFEPLGEMRCPCCGSLDLVKTNEVNCTNVSRFPVYRCNSCGKPSSSRKSELETDERKAILRNVR